MQLGIMDLLSIQESLDSYKKLLEWLPAVDNVEADLKRERIGTTTFLVNKIEGVLGNLRKGDSNE